VTITNPTGFAGAFREAVVAVLDAIATAGDERRSSLENARLAVEKALRDSHSGEEWYLADHLRRGIRDVSAHAWDAAWEPAPDL
jgi:hypothetical protein